jgi:hypothetical protein
MNMGTGVTLFLTINHRIHAGEELTTTLINPNQLRVKELLLMTVLDTLPLILT